MNSNIQGDWFQVVHGINGSKYDGVWLLDVPSGNWYYMMNSSGTGFTLGEVFASTPFGSLRGDIFSGYCTRGTYVGCGITFYDNENEYLGDVFADGQGYWLYWSGNEVMSGDLGHLWGW